MSVKEPSALGYGRDGFDIDINIDADIIRSHRAFRDLAYGR